jgi:glycosyltransferase involved in cell wall biosynthesis
VGGLGEVVTPDSGVLVEPFDVSALAAAALGILADGPRREALGRAARERVEAHFRREPAIDRYEAFYRGVLAAGASPG